MSFVGKSLSEPTATHTDTHPHSQEDFLELEVLKVKLKGRREAPTEFE